MNGRTSSQVLSWRARGRRQLLAGTVGLSVLSAVAVGGVMVAQGEGGSTDSPGAATGGMADSTSSSSGSSNSVTSTGRSSVATSSGS